MGMHMSASAAHQVTLRVGSRLPQRAGAHKQLDRHSHSFHAPAPGHAPCPLPSRAASTSVATASPCSVGGAPSRELQALPSLPWARGGGGPAPADADEFEMQLLSLERSCSLDALGSSELDSLLACPPGG